MKKITKFLPLLLISIIGMAFVSCDKDDNDEYITYEQLPTQAKQFLSQYFPTANILSTQKDNDEYEVVLNGGAKIDFTLTGEWKDVDGAPGQTIPTGFYTSEIDQYIADNYTGTGINEISKTDYGYDVELLTGLDLKFNYSGEFISIDK